MAYTVTNSSPGARGLVNLTIEAGEVREGVELTDDEALLLGELDGVTVEESKAAKKAAVTKAADTASE